MGIVKAFVATLLVFLFVFQLAQAFHPIQLDAASVGTYPPIKINCGKACAARCILSKRPNLCNRACGTCCGRCNCVPPGTSGNYESCDCYAQMTTRENKRKCP